MSHIFISYRSTERDFAQKLAGDLQANGFSIWMDVLGGIQPSDDWIRALETGVDNAVAMLPVLSPDYLTSKYCMRELQRGDGKGLPMFPALLKPIKALPMELQRTQYVDFTGDYAPKLDDLVKALQDKSITTSTPTASTTGVMVPLRKQEDQMARIEAGLKQKSNARKAKRLTMQLDMAEKQHDAVTIALLVNLNPGDIPKLQMQVQLLEEQMDDLEKQLAKLD